MNKLASLVALVAAPLLCLGLSTPMANGQDVANLTSARSNALARAYLRPSISNIFITDGSREAKSFVDQYAEYKDGKFDDNIINTKSFQITGIDLRDKDQRLSLEEQITSFLAKERVGNQIMRAWFPTFENGAYTLSVLEERGRFGATDDDVVRAKAAQRGVEAILNELGEKLIDRSYIVVYYVAKQQDEKTQSLVAYPLVYKLDFSAEVMMDFYKNHFASADGIEKANFPLILVYSPKKKKASKWNIFGGSANGFSSLIDPKDQDAEKIVERNSNLFNEIYVDLGQNVSDFQVKSPVVSTSPIQAKIGTKENLVTDRRFNVYEQVLDDNGSIVSKRRGTVRVGTHIANNSSFATGESADFTKFYQYAGGGIEEGMTLVENPDLGIGVSLIGTYMQAGFEIDYRASDLAAKLFKGKGAIPGMFVYFRGAVPFGTKATKDDKFGLITMELNSETEFVGRGEFGIRKEFNFARFLNVSLNAGYGAFVMDRKYKLDWSFANAGLRLGAYVSPSINIYAMAEYGIFFGEHKDLAKDYGVTPYNFGIGARIGF